MILASVAFITGCQKNEQFPSMKMSRQPVLNKRVEVVSNSVASKRKKKMPTVSNPASPVTVQRDSIR